MLHPKGKTVYDYVSGKTAFSISDVVMSGFFDFLLSVLFCIEKEGRINEEMV